MQVGTDILSLKRFKKVFDRFQIRLINKILSEKEIKLYTNFTCAKRKLEFLGGRFCGKEAIFKAIDDGNKFVTWKQISIIPSIEIGGKIKSKRPEVYINDTKKDQISISISHEDEYFMSVAISINTH